MWLSKIPNCNYTYPILSDIYYSVDAYNNLLEYLFSKIKSYTYIIPYIPRRVYFIASEISIPDNTKLSPFPAIS